MRFLRSQIAVALTPFLGVAVDTTAAAAAAGEGVGDDADDVEAHSRSRVTRRVMAVAMRKCEKEELRCEGSCPLWGRGSWLGASGDVSFVGSNPYCPLSVCLSVTVTRPLNRFVWMYLCVILCVCHFLCVSYISPLHAQCR